MASTRPYVVFTGFPTGFSLTSFRIMVAAAGALLLGGYFPAQAQVSLTGVSPYVATTGPINYQLSNVTTVGGAQVTGGFTYNGTTVTSVAISTAADSTSGIAADTFSIVQSFAVVGTEQQLVAADAASGTIVISFSATLGTASQISIDPGTPTLAASFISDGTNSAAVSGSIVASAGNFGNVNVCPSATPCSQTLTLTYGVNTNATFATTPTVVTQGASGLDFQLSSSIASTCTGPVSAGSSCTVTVTFAPIAPGLRLGAVQLLDGSSNVLATTLVGGIGQGPSVAFDPGFATAIGSGFANPYSMTVDAAGDVFIADYGNSRVVEVPYLALTGTYGPQITIASNPGVYLPAAVAVDGAGNVFIADWGQGQVVELPYLGNGNYGTQIQLAGIDSQGLAVDAAGDVFISDWANGDVVEVPAGGGAQITVVTGLNRPEGVAVDAAGDVFVADAAGHRVLEVTPSGTQSTVGSGWSNPTGVAVDAAGDVFISDTGLNQVVEVPAGGGTQTPLNTGSFTFESPGFPAVDGAGNVYIANLSSATGSTFFVAKIARSQAPSLTFPGTGMGSTSSPQPVTVQNVGNEQLTGVSSGLIVSPSDFIEVGGPETLGTPADCSGTAALAPGVSCDLSISFQPASVNPLITGTAVFNDNALNAVGAQQIIALSGAGLATQAITFGNPPSPSVVVGGTGTVSATGGSSTSPVVLTSKSPLVCTVAGSVVSGATVGSCTIAADQAGDSTHAAAPEVTQSFLIGQGSQTITFGTPPSPSVGVGATGTVSATGGASTSPVVLTSNSPLVCTVASSVVSGATVGTVTGVSVGQCTIAADQAGDTNYKAAPEATQQFSIVQGTQTITFGTAPTAATGSIVAVSATASSGLPVTFSSLSGSICSVTGSNVTASNVGTCVIAADQGGDGNYLPATQATQNITVFPAQQTIVFHTITSGVTPTALIATGGGSGNPVTFTVLSGPATVAGNILTINAPGSITVEADQLGDANYYPAAPQTQQIVVSQSAQTVKFTSAIAGQVMGGTNIVGVNATTTSGLPVFLTSSPTSVCTVTGTAITLVNFGVCTITANQPGNAYYFAADPVSESFTVAKETLGTTTLYFSAAGGTGSIEVGFLPYPTKPSDFTATAPWTASQSPFDVHMSLNGNPCVVSPLTFGVCQVSGTGPGVITFKLDANLSPQPRTVDVELDSGQFLLLKQPGASYIGVNPLTQLQSSGLKNPNGLAIDGSGDVYIADTGNNAIEEWIPAATLSAQPQFKTLSCPGVVTPSGVAVDGSGNAYIADTGNQSIEECNPSSHQVTILVPNLNQPAGIAVDLIGNVYFTDSVANTIMEWIAPTASVPAPNPQVITLASGLNNPAGVAVDAAGNLYIADTGNKAIEEWSPLTGNVATLVSTGLGTPTGVAVDGSGNVYIADTGKNAVLEWNAYAQQLNPVQWTGSKVLNSPAGVAVDSIGDVYAANASDISEIPVAFLSPTNFTEPATGAAGVTLFPLVPSSGSLTGPFAPSVGGATWLSITSILNGGITFSVSSNVGNPQRVGQVTVLGLVYTVTQYGTVSAQTITFNPLSNRVFGSGTFTVSATASSGLAVTFSSLTTSVCTVAGSTVTLVNVGTCTIQANQAGNSSYAAATPNPQSFQVTQASQTITFGTLANRAFSNATFTVSATASSGLAVTFSSLTTPVCTVSGSTVTLAGVGTCTIQASQAGSAKYAAVSLSRSFTVTQATQTITFATLANRAFSSTPFTVSATASSGLAVTFTSTTPLVCTNSGNSVTMVAVGTCTIQAAQGGSATWAAATPLPRSFSVTKATQTITFAKPAGQTFGVAPFTVSATASSGLTVGFASTTGSVCTVSVNTVTIVSAGTCTLQASQAGNSNWSAAANVSQSFTVAKASQTVAFAQPPSHSVSAGKFTVSATASSGLTVTFTSSTSTVCTVSVATVTPLKTGTCTIVAAQAGNTNYTAAASVSRSITLTP
jgi:sugar lactone lactonase YvrE